MKLWGGRDFENTGDIELSVYFTDTGMEHLGEQIGRTAEAAWGMTDGGPAPKGDDEPRPSPKRLEIRRSMPRHAKPCTDNLRTKMLDFRGFDSSIILSLRGGFIRSTGDFLEIMNERILVCGLFVCGLTAVHQAAISLNHINIVYIYISLSLSIYIYIEREINIYNMRVLYIYIYIYIYL